MSKLCRRRTLRQHDASPRTLRSNKLDVIRVWNRIVLMLGLLLPSILFSQPKIKWGEVPRADLEMKTFPADTNAAAVILSDVGEVAFDDQFIMVFKRHRRIKILSKAGFDWGNFAFTFYAKDRLQSVRDVEGQTFNLTPDGAIRKEKMDKKSVFDENVDGEYRRIRFTLPDLSPGCIIEYRYRIDSKYGTFLQDWVFQTSEPTRWSEFRADIPEVLEYVRFQQGILALAVNEIEAYPWPSTMYGYLAAKTFNLKINSHRWAMGDIPALREEAYMTTPEDFRAKLRFQLSRIVWPGEMPTPVMNSWEKLAEDLMDSPSFGGQIERHKVLRQQTETLVAGLNNPEQKLRAIYDYVRATMDWNGERGIYTSVDLDKAFQMRRAGGPEIALMLTGMLRFAGLEAHPVLISTRDHGQPIQIYSILSQFNHVLTHAKIGAQEYLLDATDPLRPHNMLPEPALNGAGWLVQKKTPRWIKIASAASFKNYTSVHASLAADGAIAGRFMSSDAGYSGLFERHTLRDEKAEEYIRNRWLNDLAGAKLDAFKISNQDSTHLPLATEAHFSTADHVQAAGDNIYFNPLFFGRQEENPFKQPERTFPVDFAYSRQLTYTLNLALPEGYAVQEAPRNISLVLPRDGAQFRRVTQVEGRNLQFISQVTIRKPHFEPDEYKALREFYDQIVAAHAEQIVLKREAASTAGKGGLK